MKKIVICVPTFERMLAIKKFLIKEMPLLQNKVQLYVFDSSKSYETADLIKSVSNQWVHYRRVSSDVHPNRKFYMICQYVKNMDYDYVWIIHDHTVFSYDALKFIEGALDDNADFYLLKMQSKQFAIQEIKSINEFFYLAAWTLNSFGTAILNVQTFINGINWSKMNKYLDASMINYSHIGLYFERLSEIHSPKIKILEFPRDLFYDFQRYNKPSWHKDTLRICLECWGSVIRELPSCYTCKNEVLQTSDRWFLSQYTLLELKKENKYGIIDFFRYRKWFNAIIPNMMYKAFFIALLPYVFGKNILNFKLFHAIRKANNDGRKVCIYGAGRHAVECFNYLKDCHIKIDAFLVTKSIGNPKEIDGVMVHQADEYIKVGKVFVIIAVLTSGISEIEEYLDTIKFKDIDLRYISFDK